MSEILSLIERKPSIIVQCTPMDFEEEAKLIARDFGLKEGWKIAGIESLLGLYTLNFSKEGRIAMLDEGAKSRATKKLRSLKLEKVLEEWKGEVKEKVGEMIKESVEIKIGGKKERAVPLTWLYGSICEEFWLSLRVCKEMISQLEKENLVEVVNHRPYLLGPKVSYVKVGR
jgi:hypothetical protein